MDAEQISAYERHRDFSGKPFRSACYAGYTSMVFDSIGRVRVCCVNGEYILGDIRQQRLDDIWNGRAIKRIREALDQYDFSLGCSICRHKIVAGVIEGSDLTSSQLMPLKFEEFDVESEPPYWPKHLEFHLSNKCNLQCVTCFGEFSSIIREKRDKLPPYPQAYDDQFFDDLRKYLPHLKAAQFLGGEPFIIPEMFRVWDMLIADGLTPDCHVTTNGTVFGPEVERILNELPVSISVSMDGVTKETFESIRVNARLDRVIRHLRRFKEICESRGRVVIVNFTLSRMNWHELVDFLIFAEEEGVSVSCSEVYFPESMSLFSLPAEELTRIVDSFEDRLIKDGAKFPRNRQLLEDRIREFRHHLAESQERSTHYKPSLVEPFRGTKAGPETMLYSRQRVVADLENWSGQPGVDEIVCGTDDVITSAQAKADSLLMDRDTMVGQTFADFVTRLFEVYGAKVVHLSMDKDKGREDRLMRLEGDGRTPTLVRLVMMPIYDATGSLAGARALVATRPNE